jgi:hypothetical protein
MGKPEGQRKIGTPRRRLDDNIKMDNFYCCTVHSEIHTVHSPKNALFIKLGNV